MRTPRNLPTGRWMLRLATALLIIGRAWVAVPAAAQAQPDPPDALSIEVDTPRPLAAVIRELSARHGLVITYEDPLWIDEADVEDVTDQYPWAAERIARGEPQQRLLQPRAARLAFSYRWSDFDAKSGGPGGLLERLARESANGFEVRHDGDVFHVVPTRSLDATGHWVPHVSPFDLAIRFPVERRTIQETLQVILEAVNEVSETPVSLGLVMIAPFERQTVELGSEGRTARELLVEAMRVEGLKTSWVLFYDPMLERYFFSVYPVRAPKLQPKDASNEER